MNTPESCQIPSPDAPESQQTCCTPPRCPSLASDAQARAVLIRVELRRRRDEPERQLVPVDLPDQGVGICVDCFFRNVLALRFAPLHTLLLPPLLFLPHHGARVGRPVRVVCLLSLVLVLMLAQRLARSDTLSAFIRGRRGQVQSFCERERSTGGGDNNDQDCARDDYSCGKGGAA